MGFLEWLYTPLGLEKEPPFISLGIKFTLFCLLTTVRVYTSNTRYTVEKICEQCKEYYTTNRAKRRFCSNKCSSRAQFPIMYKKCKFCKKDFKITVDRKVFCNQECYFAHKTKKTTTSICRTCENSFEHPDWNCKKPIFCNASCHRNMDPKVKYVKKAFKSLPNHCSVCVKGKGRLEVHHIDFDRSNNHISNLTIICHSCHVRLHSIIEKLTVSPEDSLSLFKRSCLFILSPDEMRRFWKRAREKNLHSSNFKNKFTILQLKAVEEIEKAVQQVKTR